MIKVRHGVVTLAAVIGAGAAPRVVAACDPVSIPMSRSPGSAVLLATAVRNRPLAAGARVEIRAGRTLTGVVSPSEAILVPWAFGPDCRPIPWNADRAWTPPESPAVYTAWPRPRDRWIDGLPTFDVHMAIREPLWPAADNRAYVASAGNSLLSATEFFEFFAILPTDQELEQRWRPALERIERWDSTQRALAQREPARSILRNVRRMFAPGAIEVQTSPAQSAPRTR